MTGLYDKYKVYHADGSPVEGRYFVLKPSTDPAAIPALYAYIRATDNKELAQDLAVWLAELTLEATRWPQKPQ